MRRRIKLFSFIKVFVVGTLFSALAHSAIFGPTDVRTYSNEASPSYPQGRATAIAILKTLVTSTSSGLLKVDADSFSSSVCKDEKFSGDPSVSFSCTGFLVAPDLIVTAGHCMVNAGQEARNEPYGYCQVFDWLFDYEMPVGGNIDLGSIPENKLFHCKKIIYAVSDEKAPFRDYALVQLDRPVTDRAPLKISQGPIASAEVLSMLGYPFGTPVKLSPNAKILLDNPARSSFITNLDAFEGNSGSPVLNAKNEVVGILIAGTPSDSFFQDPKKNCPIYNRCDANGKNCLSPDKDTSIFPGFQQVGSEVSRIGPVQDLLRTLPDVK